MSPRHRDCLSHPTVSTCPISSCINSLRLPLYFVRLSLSSVLSWATRHRESNCFMFQESIFLFIVLPKFVFLHPALLRNVSFVPCFSSLPEILIYYFSSFSFPALLWFFCFSCISIFRSPALQRFFVRTLFFAISVEIFNKSTVAFETCESCVWVLCEFLSI